MAHFNGRDIYDLILERIDGRPMRLARYWGQVLLIVNMASRCDRAGQLEGLEALHRRYHDAGLRIIGFPCNDFGGEPGSDNDVHQRYERTIRSGIAVFSRVCVANEPRHPLFDMLADQESPIRQNFEKFLVGRDGHVLARFGPDVQPLSLETVPAIEASLQKQRRDWRIDGYRPRPAIAAPASGWPCVASMAAR